jgi:hypothetical protein
MRSGATTSMNSQTRSPAPSRKTWHSASMWVVPWVCIVNTSSAPPGPGPNVLRLLGGDVVKGAALIVRSPAITIARLTAHDDSIPPVLD